MSFQDVPIHQKPQNYPYRAYLSEMVSLPSEAKLTNLASGGYAKDKSGLFNKIENPGNIARRALFRTVEDSSNPSQGDYSGEEVLFIARLHHDFNSCSVYF